MPDYSASTPTLRPPLRVWLGIATLARSAGGPAVVVQQLSEHLLALGVEVTILTRLLPEVEPEFLPIEERVGIVRVSTSNGLMMSCKTTCGVRESITHARKLGQIDVFHDFGLWLPCNHEAASVCARLRLPYISSTCGMLSPWALRHKPWKKRIAWRLYQRRDLLRARVLVATSKQEKEHIADLLPDRPVALVPNGVNVPDTAGPTNKESEARNLAEAKQKTLLFLGRIHPVKGLMTLVEAWARVRPPGWRCIIAGPDESGHQHEIEDALKRHGIAEDFSFPGMVDGADKACLLAHADLFVLPSFTENFGIAAAEAMASGIPVITTKGTPWSELISCRCGWWIELGEDALATALQEAVSLNDHQRREMGWRGRCLVEENYSWRKIAQDMKEVYEWVLNREPKPNGLLSEQDSGA